MAETCPVMGELPEDTQQKIREKGDGARFHNDPEFVRDTLKELGAKLPDNIPDLNDIPIVDIREQARSATQSPSEAVSIDSNDKPEASESTSSNQEDTAHKIGSFLTADEDSWHWGEGVVEPTPDSLLDDVRARLEAHILLDEPEPAHDTVPEVITTADARTPEPVLPPDVVLEAKRIVNEVPKPEPADDNYEEPISVAPETVDSVEPEPRPAAIVEEAVAQEIEAEPEPGPEPEAAVTAPVIPPLPPLPELRAVDVVESNEPEPEPAPMPEPIIIVEPAAPELPDTAQTTELGLPTPEPEDDPMLAFEIENRDEESQEADALYSELQLPAPVFETSETTDDAFEFSFEDDKEQDFPNIPLTAEELLAAIDRAKAEQVIELHDEAAPVVEGEMVEFYDRTKQPEPTPVRAETAGQSAEETVVAQIIPVEVKEQIVQYQQESGSEDKTATTVLVTAIEQATAQLIELEQADEPNKHMIKKIEAEITQTYNQLLEKVGVKSLPERKKLAKTFIAAIKVQAVTRQIEDDEGTHEFKRALNAAFAQQSTNLQGCATQLGKLIVATIRNPGYAFHQ